MKIVIDRAIPFLEGVLEPWAETVYCAGSAIDPDTVRDADALIVRTRTRCNEQLLSGSRVRFIATATIGFDHIDTAWCAAHGIEVSTAAGCNARGVLQWVAAALVWLSRRQGWRPADRTLGVIGVGHVGSLVAEYAAAWGFRVLCCDPPREACDRFFELSGQAALSHERTSRKRLDFFPLEQVAREADLLTFHTPLDASTRHMVDERLLRSMRPEAVVLNTSRGEVADTAALLASGHPCLLDVWEHEPQIDRALLDRALLATPHIAGYSEQGKANATALSVRALACRFGLPLTEWYPPQVRPSEPRPIAWQEFCGTIDDRFGIEAQSRALKIRPEAFETMRDNYVYRREYF